MEVLDSSHMNDPHRMEFEEFIYDTHRTAEDLRHLLLKQYDEIQDLRRKLGPVVEKAAAPS